MIFTQVPHYTALFEKLVRGPKPWYFGHILLPGGSANLRIPKYNLKDGPEATTLGTVMECLAVERCVEIKYRAPHAIDATLSP